MVKQNPRIFAVLIALGLCLICVAWSAAAPPAAGGTGSGFGLHFFSRKKTTETSNKPPAESIRNHGRTDSLSSRNSESAKKSPGNARDLDVERSVAPARTAARPLPVFRSLDRPPAKPLASTQGDSGDVEGPGPGELPHESPEDGNIESNRPANRADAGSPIPPPPDAGDDAEFFPAPRDADAPPREVSKLLNDAVAEGDSRLTVSWKFDEEISVGESRTAALIVRNDGKHEVTDVVVRAALSDSLVIVRSTPERERTKQLSIWRFERIPPESSREIELLVRGALPGEAGCVANVSASQTVSRAVRVQRPELTIAVVAPTAAAVGDPVAAVVEIANPGRGFVRDVRVSVELSEGLLHARGREFEISAGSLAQGESRKLKIPLNAVRLGLQTATVAATAVGAERREATAEFDVVGPRLSLEVTGPALRYVDRRAKYVVAIRNEGNAECSNLRLRLQPPPGFEFADATEGGAWDSELQSVEWFVAEVRGGAAAEFAVELIARRPGVYSLAAQAVTDQGATVEASTETVVDTTPKLVVEVVERDDPVEVGVETAWEIRIRNDGSRPSTRNRIFAELPNGVKLVEARGPTKSASDRELVAFAALGELKPGAIATYTLRVTGTAAGSQRLKVRATSAEGDPILVEETTRFYSDR